jgi:hypothetical protein
MPVKQRIQVFVEIERIALIYSLLDALDSDAPANARTAVGSQRTLRNPYDEWRVVLGSNTLCK